MASLYTKTGDQGETGLVGGTRVRKTDLRVECYGTIDEMGSALGFAKSLTTWNYVEKTVQHIQERLLFLGAEIASDTTGLKTLNHLISKEDVTYLEHVVNQCTKINGKQTAFVIPGENPPSGALHFSRTVVRRCERLLIALSQEDLVRKVVLQFVNRLSDAVYALARLEETLREQGPLMETIKEVIEEQEIMIGAFPLTLKQSQKLARRALERAKKLGIHIVFATVDEGGNTILLHRMERALLGSIDVALNKAFTANAFQMGTHELGEQAKQNGEFYSVDSSNQGRVILFGGGLPYKYKNRIIGGIGVSGGSALQDLEIANYALGK